jgi:hypothetical protein
MLELTGLSRVPTSVYALRQHTSAYISVCYVSIRQRMLGLTAYLVIKSQSHCSGSRRGLVD